MNKISLLVAFAAIFMFVAVGNQGVSVDMMGSPAFAGDDDSNSRESSSKDSNSKESSSKDSNSKDSSSKDSNSNDNSTENESDDGYADNEESGSDREEVCHNGTNTLSIDENAVAAHIAHGDTMGECADSEEIAEAEVVYSCDCPPGVACTCPDGTAGFSSGLPTAAGPSKYRSF